MAMVVQSDEISSTLNSPQKRRGVYFQTMTSGYQQLSVGRDVLNPCRLKACVPKNKVKHCQIFRLENVTTSTITITVAMTNGCSS